jgi:hypothetical protein
MQQKLEEDKSLGKVEDNKDVKVTLFGILAGTKALTNPVKEILEIEKQQLEILKNIDISLDSMSASQKAIAENMLKTATAVENLKIR